MDHFKTILHHHASQVLHHHSPFHHPTTIHFPIGLSSLEYSLQAHGTYRLSFGTVHSESFALASSSVCDIFIQPDPTSETNAPSLLQYNTSAMNLQDLLNAAPELYGVRLLSIFL
jgi:hypothetical protein